MFGKHGLDDTLKDVSSKVLVIAFSSDWLYTPSENQWVVESLQRLRKEASYLEMPDTHGHDSFLKGSDDFDRAVRVFFSGMDKKEEEEQNLGRLRQVSSRYEVKKEADFKVISFTHEGIASPKVLLMMVQKLKILSLQAIQNSNKF